MDIVTDTQNAPASPSFSRGAAVIEDHLTRLPGSPGVYRMLNQAGDVLYVGKAKNLKKRVVAYTRPERLGLRIQRMVSETYTLEVVTTHTEVEALLLEANLIKKLGPKYSPLRLRAPRCLTIWANGWSPVIRI